MAEPVVLFHLPKTGGSTLWAIMRRLYPRVTRISTGSFVQNTDALRELLATHAADYDAIAAHVFIDALIPPPAPHRRITMLRDPVERAVSYYYFVLRDRPHKLEANFHTEDPTLEDGIRHGAHNEQVRYLAGVREGPITAAHTAEAKRILAEEFDAFGVTSRFDEALIGFKQVFGWPLPLYRRHKVGTNRPRTIPDEARQLALALNPHDAELYAYACDLFKARINEVAETHPAYRRDLLAFRAVNAVASRAADVRTWFRPPRKE